MSLEFVAGVLEGEGSFGMQKNKDLGGRRYHYARVSMQITDKDIADRVADELGGSVYGPYDRKRSPDHKPIYQWHVVGGAARAAMTRLLPLMGERRTAQIEEALAAPSGRVTD